MPGVVLSFDSGRCDFLYEKICSVIQIPGINVEKVKKVLCFNISLTGFVPWTLSVYC